MAKQKTRELVEHGLLYSQSFQVAPEDMVAGIDEAGRGCLAGPVVAATVVFAPDFDIMGLTDSKALTEQERLALDGDIRHLALGYGIGLAWMKEIEIHNILQATLLAMARSVAALKVRMKAEPKTLLIDGTFTIPHFFLTKYQLKPEHQKSIISGDSLIPSISAASVLAKNFRDNIMLNFDKKYPEYAFATHKGYGTKEHRMALAKYGHCPIHRLGFKGVLPPKQEQLKMF